MHVAARSDVGMVRSGNEDSFFAHATKQGGLFIVADGMGGHAAGEVASEMAVQIVSRELSDLHHLTGSAPREKVAESIKSANRAIYERTINESDKQGMGTTVSVLLVSGARWLIGQVGDSRIYLLRDGALTQLTKDIGAKEQRHETVRRDLGAIPPGYDGAKHAALRREVERLVPLNERATRLSAQIDREPQLDHDRRRVTEALGTLRDRLALLRERHQSIAFSEGEFTALRTAYGGTLEPRGFVRVEVGRNLMEEGKTQRLLWTGMQDLPPSPTFRDLGKSTLPTVLKVVNDYLMGRASGA